MGETSGGDVKDRGAGAVDGLAIDLEPLAQLLEAVTPGLRDDALGVGPDVQEMVASLAGDVDEVAEEGLGGFEVGVVVLADPGVVDGHAGLPIAAREALRGDVLLGCFGVALVSPSQAVVPDEVRVLVENLDNLGGTLRGHLPRCVEPDDDWIVLVVVEELFNLGDGLFVKVIIETAILGLVTVAGLLVVVARDRCGDDAAAPGGDLLERVLS